MTMGAVNQLGESAQRGAIGKAADPLGVFSNNGLLQSSGLLGGGGNPPAGMDLTSAAQATAAGNLKNAQLATVANRSNTSGPTGTSSWSQDPTTGQWSQSNQLSAPLQGIANQAQTGLSNAMATPLTVGNLQTSVNASPITGGVQNNAQQINTNLSSNAGQLNTSAGDPNLLNSQVTDALYKQQTQYLDPQFQQQQEALTSQLANQGIGQGSAAYETAMKNAALQKQQAYGNAMQSAIGQGVNASNTMFGNQLANAQFGNQAIGQQFGQNLQATNANNAALGQQFGQGLNSAQFSNQAQAQQYGQGLNNAQLNNAAMQQQLQGNIDIQNAYSNRLQNMYSLTPQGTNYNQSATAGADLLGAATAQNQYNQGQYNANQAKQSAMTSGLFSLGAAAIMAPV
jgi:hypothetical protein